MEYILLIILPLSAAIYVLLSTRSSEVPKRLSRGAENAQLIKVLLDLEPESLEELFCLYRQQFGAGAAKYAKQTYLRWKGGEVRPNKQTFHRLLIHLPKVMSFDLKCEVLRELREAYCHQEHYRATVYADDWKDTVTPLVERLANKISSTLPTNLSKRLSWLAEDDMQVAEKLLEQSQRKQSLVTVSLLDQEFANIEEALDNATGKGKVTHVLKLPQGTITLDFKRR